MTAVLKPEYVNVSERDYLAYYANHHSEKYELIDGYVYAMVGTSRSHNIIAGNAFALLHAKLKECTPFMSDIKVKAGQNYYYPDVLVDCGANKDNSQFANSPKLIIEVLSKSTRKFDSTQKLADYAKIDTLEEYALIEQDFMQVLIYRKADNWRKAERYGEGDTVHFISVGISMPIDELYQRVVFDDE